MGASIGRYSDAAEIRAAWHDIEAANPDPRRTLSEATIATDEHGRRYYKNLSLWAEPPQAPKR